MARSNRQSTSRKTTIAIYVTILALAAGVFFLFPGNGNARGVPNACNRYVAQALVGYAFAQAGESGTNITLSDLLYGIIKLEGKPSLALTREQAKKLVPALKRVVEASSLFKESEEKMKTLLRKDQVDYIKEKLKDESALKEIYANIPNIPGEDPLVSRVYTILKDRASK